MKAMFRRPSPGLVVACIALGVALGGTGYATVLQVPKNSVGTPQLKNSAVTSAKVKNRSLLRSGLRRRTDPCRADRARRACWSCRTRGTGRGERGRACRVHVCE